MALRRSLLPTLSIQNISVYKLNTTTLPSTLSPVYPLDFSYTFIGKIGVLSLNPLLLADVIDIYAGNKNGFLERHPIKKNIQDSYDDRDTNTGYADVVRLVAVLKGLAGNVSTLVEQISPSEDKAVFLTFGNRYEEGVIYSRYRVGNVDKPVLSHLEKELIPKFFPENTALVTFNPHQDWTKLWNTIKENLAVDVDSGKIGLSQHLEREMTIVLVTHGEGEGSKFPSLVLHSQIKDASAFGADMEMLKSTKISVAGIPLEFLDPQNYNRINVQPVRLRFNFLLALTGAYAIVNNDFFFSTTLGGIKSVLDVKLGDAPVLSGVAFSANGVQTFSQPNLLVPEIERLIPIATILASLSGMKLDARLMQHIKDNLFPLESLGPITADLHVGEMGVDAEVRIVLEK